MQPNLAAIDTIAAQLQQEQDGALDEGERQRLITMTLKLVQHIKKSNKPPTKTASAMAAET